MTEPNPGRNALLIINPTSGKMKAKTGLFDILDTLNHCGVLPSVYVTQRALDAKERVMQCGSQYPLVICCGGDGTLNEVISGMVEGNHRTPIGYIPCGTTNDYATSMNLPKELPAAAANAALGVPTAQDIGLFNGEKYFTYIASFGMFTSVSYATPQFMKNMLGHLAYVIEGAKSLTDIKSYPIEIEADGISVSGDYLFGAIINTTSIAGIYKFAPEQVDLHDGLFEAVFICQPKSFADLNRILTCLRTQTPDFELFDIFRASKITVRSETPIAWTIDGEYAGEPTETVIRNLPDAASILLPKTE